MPRCLIVERHDWETGAHTHQLQFPLGVATFFGPAAVDRNIRLRVFIPSSAALPAFERNVTISHMYARSRTRRLNRFREMGAIPSAFIFFQETAQRDVYDFWWQTDKVIVAARYHPWQQGRSSQYGRGRLAIIVPTPVPRPITDL